MSPVCFKIIVKFCINLFLYLLSTFVTTIILLFWIPSLLYRRFVTIAAKVLKRDLESLLDPLGTVLADENFFENPSNCSVVTVLRIDGNLTLPILTALFVENVINAKINTDPKTARYPELQRYPENFMGYWFWKKDPNFSVKNHVKEHPEILMMPIAKIHQEMINANFPKNQSPWQLTIFRNSHPNRTFLALRIHHFLADGRSILKLFVECLGSKTLITKDAKFPKIRTQSEEATYFLSLPINLVRINVHFLKCYLKTREHPWNGQRGSANEPIPLFVGISGKISLEKVKQTARVSRVLPSAVIMHTVTSAVAKFLQFKDHNRQSESDPIYMILPKEYHPQTLKNHWSPGTPFIPQIDDDIKHLQKCSWIYKNLRQGDDFRHIDNMTFIMAAYPKTCRSIYSTIRLFPVGMSNIAGEQEGFFVGEYPCLGFTMSVGLSQLLTGVSFTVISYKETFQVSVVATGSVLTERETVTLARFVEKEFMTLSQFVLG